MIQRQTIRIINENLTSKAQGRISIALDTSVWFNLAEYNDEQVKRVKSLLSKLVEAEKIFCPLTFSTLSELLRRSAENARKVAGVMDELSLGIAFVQNSEIYYREIEMFLLSSLKNQVFNVGRKELFGPVMGWLGGNLHLDFPAGFPASSDELENFMAQSANHVNTLTVTGLINLLQPVLPISGIVEQPNYDWRRRWQENNGNKNKLRLIEKQAVFQRIIDEIIKETDSVDAFKSYLFKTNVKNYINSLPKGDDGTSADAVLERMPAHTNMVEVMTFAGFDPNRTDKMNDFYDLELLIIPAAYADVIIATDKWIKNLMKSYGERLHRNSAKYYGNWTDFEEYLKSL